jgi:hypothetical protein
MSRYNYRSINNVGENYRSDTDNPLTYSLNNTIAQKFLHGGNSTIYGQNSRQSQAFLSEYCSQNWDGACELASKNNDSFYPNSLVYGGFNSRPYNFKGLNAGETLIRNTACKKYLVGMGNCKPKYEPFDPLVADSPMIAHWYSESGTNDCVPVYDVNHEGLDNDIIMNKILDKPTIALDVLINIYNTRNRVGTLDQLNDTRLGNFFKNNPTIFK